MNAMHIAREEEGGEGRGEDGEGNVSMARYERFPTEGAGWNDEMGLK